jgi:DNA-binding response OmpR family regulator
MRILVVEDELDRHHRIATRAGQLLPLAGKEFAVLECLMMRAPEVASRSGLLDHVGDTHFDKETNVVEVYINRLRQKMGPPRAIRTVHGIDYCLGTDS